MLTWATESDARRWKLFRRRAKSQSGNTPLALSEVWSPGSLPGRQENEPPRRGRPRQRKRTLGPIKIGCLFGCGGLPREATPEEAVSISPLPSAPTLGAARQLRAALKERATRRSGRSGLVEQLCYQGVVRSSSAGSLLERPHTSEGSQISLEAGTPIALPPSKEAILQELERARMRNEDRQVRTPEKVVAAPAPEQLPSPAELRLRTPKRSTSRQGKKPPRGASQDQKLQLAVEVSANAFHSSWATISTPSTRASPGIHQASWSDVSSPAGSSPGCRRRAATADARNFERLEEAQALLSEMLSGGNKSSSSRSASLQDGRRRHESAPPKAQLWQPWASPPAPLRRMQTPGSYSAPGGSFLTPLNGSMPWVPQIEIERPGLKTQGRSASEKRLAPLAPLVEHTGSLGSTRPQPVLAQSLAIPEGCGREPEVCERCVGEGADEEFCQILAAALASHDGYGLVEEQKADSSAPEELVPGSITVCHSTPSPRRCEEHSVPGLESPPSSPSKSPASGMLTPLPLPPSRGESPTVVLGSHPFGPEATPRSVSQETRAAEVKPRVKSPKRIARRKDFAQVMAERRRLEEAQPAKVIPVNR